MPAFLHATARSAGELNWGYPIYGGPASVTSKLAIAISASAITGFMYLKTSS
jgi:hypothetical protein